MEVSKKEGELVLPFVFVNMAMQYAPTSLQVPEGFEEVLNDFSREVLRAQPEDVVAFAAKYFREAAAKLPPGRVVLLVKLHFQLVLELYAILSDLYMKTVHECLKMLPQSFI